jgi:hypothetical protein
MEIWVDVVPGAVPEVVCALLLAVQRWIEHQRAMQAAQTNASARQQHALVADVHNLDLITTSNARKMVGRTKAGT